MNVFPDVKNKVVTYDPISLLYMQLPMDPIRAVNKYRPNKPVVYAK